MDSVVVVPQLVELELDVELVVLPPLVLVELELVVLPPLVLVELELVEVFPPEEVELELVLESVVVVPL